MFVPRSVKNTQVSCDLSVEFFNVNLVVPKVTGRLLKVSIPLPQNELRYVSHFTKAPIHFTVMFLAILCSTLTSFSFITNYTKAIHNTAFTMYSQMTFSVNMVSLIVLLFLFYFIAVNNSQLE